MKEEGKELSKDQLQAIEKLPEVTIQLDTVKDLQKQFQQLQTEVMATAMICCYDATLRLTNRRRRRIS